MSAHVHAPVFLTSSTDRAGHARRALDCLVVFVVLICLAPLMAAIAAAIWVESGGPVFFSQARLGRGGERFRLHKFRKFHAQESPSGLAVTLKNDSRMTCVGRVLERTKLDELPQLWNIVVGEMALVGPRPESLAFADCFDGAYNRGLDYRPGLFGPSQVVFRNESAFYELGCDPEAFYRSVLFPLKANVDLAYFPHRTMLSDAGWAIHSVLAVFGWSFLPDEAMRGIEGVENWVQEFSQLAA